MPNDPAADDAQRTLLQESIPPERTPAPRNRLAKTGAGLLLARLATRLDPPALASGVGISERELRALLAGDRGLTAAQQLRLAETALARFPPGTDLHRRAAAVRGQVRVAHEGELGDRLSHAHPRGRRA